MIEQAAMREVNLPQGTRQGLVLDARGQSGLNQTMLDRLVRRIERRTSGAIKAEDVLIMR